MITSLALSGGGRGRMKSRIIRSAMSLLAFCCLLADPALGQADADNGFETIKVEGDKVLPGIWKIPPHERGVLLSKSDVIADFDNRGPEKICRIGRAAHGYSFNCLEIAERYPEANFDSNGQLQLSWKAVMMGKITGCRWTIHGRLQSATEIAGHLGMHCDTLSGERLAPLTITKLVLSEQTADDGGQAAFLKHLLEEMAVGPVKEPYAKPYLFTSTPHVTVIPQDVQQQMLVFPTPDSLRPLGAVAAVVYVGDYIPMVGWQGNPWRPVYAGKQPVYAVEFENGERLCTLRRKPDGVLDRFQCL